MSSSDDLGAGEGTDSLSAGLDEAFGEDISSDGPATAFLVGLSGRHAGKLFRLPVGESIVGRSSRSLVTLDEKAVSHQHAKLTLNNQGCTIEDLGSTNGSFVNDQRLRKPRVLNAGDVLRFGTSTLGFLTDAEDEGQHTRALARVTQPTFGTPRALGPGASSGGGSIVYTSPALAVAHPHDSHEVGGSLTIGAPEQSPLDSALDKLDLIVAFLKNYWELIAVFCAVFSVLGALTIAINPPLSTAEFEIFLREAEAKGTSRYFASQTVEYFASAEKNFSNLDLVRQSMSDMKLPTPESAVLGTAKGLEFKKDGRSSIYKGTYSHPNPQLAEDFLALHLKNYLEREIGKSIKVLRSETELLQTQYQDNEAKLKEHEATLQEFKEKHLGALPELARGQLDSKASLMALRDSLSASLTRATQQLALKKRQLASNDALVGAKVLQSQPYESGLAEVRRQIAAARAQGLAEGHPDVVRLLNEEKSLLRLRDSTINATTSDAESRSNLEQKALRNEVGELQVAVSATGQELSGVQGQLGAIETISKKMPEVEAQLAAKIREVESSKRLHEKLFEQLKAKELELQFERASVAARYEVLSPPRAFKIDLVRSILLRAGAGAVAGAMLALLVAVLHWIRLYARKRRIRTSSTDLVVVE